MISSALALAGALAGAWLWWMRNRAKTRIQKTDEEIEARNEQRKKNIDGWVRGVGSDAWWNRP